MKKRMVAFLCMLLLLSAVVPLTTLAASDVFFLAVNDELPELTTETTPIRVGGITYLPCTVFDKRVTGVNLGVFYRWNPSEERITLYSKDRTLEFNIKAGTAYSYNEEREYSYQAVVRNGLPYVPAYLSCEYFGLRCQLLITEDTQFQLLRVKNGNQVLDDTMLLRSARPLLEERVAKHNTGGKTNGNPSGGGIDSDSSGDATGREVYVAVRVEDGQNLPGILSAMKGNRQVKGIFFFSADQLASCDDTLRELVKNGQRIGLIAKGASSEEQLGSLQEGNRLLKHILRQKAVFVLNEGFSEDMQNDLRAEGYLPWKANITAGSRAQSDSALYQTVLDRISSGKGKARLLLGDNTKGGTVSSILRQLREDQYDIRNLRETDF